MKIKIYCEICNKYVVLPKFIDFLKDDCTDKSKGMYADVVCPECDVYIFNLNCSSLKHTGKYRLVLEKVKKGKE